MYFADLTEAHELFRARMRRFVEKEIVLPRRSPGRSR